MNISSRTPEGRFNHCPVCGQHIWMEPSEPSGDAPCPHCGVLLWFVETVNGLAFFDQAEFIRNRHALTVFSHSSFSHSSGQLDESTCEVTFFDFEVGSRVRIREGTFESFEGTVEQIDPFAGKVRVIITIFGRETPVELMIWQVESI